jgi:hypothetical protein
MITVIIRQYPTHHLSLPQGRTVKRRQGLVIQMDVKKAQVLPLEGCPLQSNQ